MIAGPVLLLAFLLIAAGLVYLLRRIETLAALLAAGATTGDPGHNRRTARVARPAGHDSGYFPAHYSVLASRSGLLAGCGRSNLHPGMAYLSRPDVLSIRDGTAGAMDRCNAGPSAD